MAHVLAFPHRALAQTSLCLVLATAAAADQEPQPPSGVEQEKRASNAAPRNEEVGGRLVITGETIVVVADPDDQVNTSSLATKTDTRLLETPRSVTVVDRRALDELQAINLTQAHDYTLGLSSEDERGPAFDRGFRVGFYDLRRDGLRTYTWSVREPAALERIQYLRGPAAILYGDGSPGGLVNLVLKKPLPVPIYTASLGAGSLGFRRATLDLTGPVTEGRSVRYRLVGAAEGLENGFDNGEARVSVLPMLSFDLGPKATFHLDGEYYDQRGRGYRHSVPATPETQKGDFSAIPWDLNMASPDDSWRGWNASGGVRLDVRLSDRFALHAAGRYTKIDGDIDVQALVGLAADGRTARRFAYREKSVWDEYQSDSFVTFLAKTGSIAHNVVAGVEAGLSTVDSKIGIGAAPSLEIDAPVYGPKPPEPSLRPTGNDMLRVGVYLQDQLAVGRFRFVPALRWSRLSLEDRAPAAAGPSGSAPVSHDSKLTPSLGLLFLPRPWLSLYASGSEGFEPPTPGQYQEDGQALAPVESRSLEAGVKAELLGSRLAVTATGFQISQTQVPEVNARGLYSQIGAGKSDGVEIEVVGSLARGLVVRGGYAFTRTEITRDAAGFVGRDLPNAPQDKANLWVRHRFSADALRHLCVGMGLVHVSSRFTSRDNSVRLPAYTRLDATASFEVLRPRLTLALVAENLADTRYVTAGAGRAFFAGPPRRLAATLSTTF